MKYLKTLSKACLIFHLSISLISFLSFALAERTPVENQPACYSSLNEESQYTPRMQSISSGIVIPEVICIGFLGAENLTSFLRIVRFLTIDAVLLLSVNFLFYFHIPYFASLVLPFVILKNTTVKKT